MVYKSILLLFCFFSIAAYSENLKAQQDFLYSTKVFSGSHFTKMNRVKGQTIFLLANKPNFIQLSFLANNNSVDSEDLSKIFLVIYKDNIIIKQIAIEKIFIYNQVDDQSNNWKVFKGVKADIESTLINGIKKRYAKSYKKYLAEYETVNRSKKEILQKIKKLSLAGMSTSKLSMDFQALKFPEKPSEPHIQKDSQFKAYYVNLPEGEYQIIARHANGIFFEKSQIKLVLISPRRKNIVGYQIIPGNIWSPPLNLNGIKQILYTNGKSNLYMTPYFQNEYNDYYIRQVLSDQQAGNPSQFKHIKTNKILNMQAEIISSRQTQVIFEQLFDFESNTKFPMNEYSYNYITKKEENYDLLRAFYIPLNETPSYIKIRLQNNEGKYMQSSTREIRVVDSKRFPVILYLIAFFPLIFMFVIIIKRRKDQK